MIIVRKFYEMEEGGGGGGEDWYKRAYLSQNKELQNLKLKMETLQKKTKANNTVNRLDLYRTNGGIWCFGDKDLDIVGEPFIGEINLMIDMYANGKENVTIFISSSEIPSYTLSLTRIDGGFEGMYQLDGTEIEGWLCPCLLNYFPEYVKKIYVQFKY